MGEHGPRYALHRGEFACAKNATYLAKFADQLGAIRFDRDVRSIANYLSTQTEFGGGRDKFTRLQQIATVLNLDPVSCSKPRTKNPTKIDDGTG